MGVCTGNGPQFLPQCGGDDGHIGAERGEFWVLVALHTGKPSAVTSVPEAVRAVTHFLLDPIVYRWPTGTLSLLYCTSKGSFRWR